MRSVPWGRTGWRRLAVALAWLAIVVALQVWALSAGISPAEAAARAADAVSASPWGVLAFTVLYLVRPLLLFSAAVLTVAAGVLFGAWVGVPVVVIAANASAMVAYGAARWVTGEPAGEERLIGRYARRLRARSLETVVVMRLLFLPYDLVSYVCGALRIRPLPFLVGTAVGSLPATVALVLFGASLEDFDGGVPRIGLPTLAVSVGLLAATLAGAWILRRREAARDG